METPLTDQPSPLAGGVVMADVPVTLPSPTMPDVSQSNPVYTQETIVVPPQQAENPFIPKGVAPQGEANPVPPPPSGNPLLRRLLMLVVFAVLLVGLLFLGKFVLGLFAGAKEVPITYWGLWENDATVRGVMSDFEAQHPKIKVSYVKQSPKQYRERLQAAIERGDGPDVFRFHNTWVAMLRNELTPVLKIVMTPAEFSTIFYPVAKADLVAGNTIYGIPMMMEGLGLYYNEDLFASAGVAPPTTWTDVINMVPKLTVKKNNTIVTSAIALGTTGNVENFSDILATMFMQNGADLTQLSGKEAEETLVFYRKFADPSDLLYTWNETLDNSVYAFATGRVAMILAPSWRAFDIVQMNPQLHFKIAPIPQLPGNSVTWASYWVEGVSAKTKHQQQAWELVKYMTSQPVVTKLYTEEAKTRLFGEPYVRVDMASSLTNDPYVGAFIKQAPYAKSFPLASRTFDNGINDKLIKYLVDAVNGYAAGSAPTAVLETAAAGFRQVLAAYGLVTRSAPAKP